MEDTKIDGRIDIVIFPNGGWELIGRTNSDPEINEDIYMPEIKAFVQANQGLNAPQKFTCLYRIKDDRLAMKWGEWKGEIQRFETNENEIDI